MGVGDFCGGTTSHSKMQARRRLFISDAIWPSFSSMSSNRSNCATRSPCSAASRMLARRDGVSPRVGCVASSRCRLARRAVCGSATSGRDIGRPSGPRITGRVLAMCGSPTSRRRARAARHRRRRTARRRACAACARAWCQGCCQNRAGGAAGIIPIAPAPSAYKSAPSAGAVSGGAVAVGHGAAPGGGDLLDCKIGMTRAHLENAQAPVSGLARTAMSSGRGRQRPVRDCCHGGAGISRLLTHAGLVHHTQRGSGARRQQHVLLGKLARRRSMISRVHGVAHRAARR